MGQKPIRDCQVSPGKGREVEQRGGGGGGMKELERARVRGFCERKEAEAK